MWKIGKFVYVSSVPLLTSHSLREGDVRTVYNRTPPGLPRLGVEDFLRTTESPEGMNFTRTVLIVVNFRGSFHVSEDWERTGCRVRKIVLEVH